MKISRRSARRADMPSFKTLDIFAAAHALEASGRRVVQMAAGQPGGGASLAARQALGAALGDTLGYTEALGRPSLRAKIADWTSRRYGVEVAPSRVIVTMGSSTAFQLAFLGLFDPGARFALSDPSFPSYGVMAASLGLDVVRVPSSFAAGWRPTPEQLAAAGAERPLDGVLLASPSNPTGATLRRDELEAMLAECGRQNAWFLSDEIYHGLEFGDRAVSALEVSDDVIVINSFSKYFRMSGWRIGWMIAPERLVPVFETLSQFYFICPPHASQIAAEAALDDEAALAPDRALYAKNRDRVLAALSNLGFNDVLPPDGGFYVYAGVKNLLREGEDSLRWCLTLLNEAGVAVAPGWDFDAARGGETVRFSFCGAEADIEEGLSRLSDWATARGV